MFDVFYIFDGVSKSCYIGLACILDHGYCSLVCLIAVMIIDLIFRWYCGANGGLGWLLPESNIPI